MNDVECRYPSKSVLETLAISRSSLLYYERIGLIEKHTRKGSGYRRYSDSDIFKLFAYSALRTVGYPANDATERLRSDEDFLGAANLADYRQLVDERIAFDTALKRALDFFAQARARFDAHGPFIAEAPIPRFDFYPDSAEQGYDSATFNATHDELVRLMPISGFGVTYEGDFLERRVKRRWARTIPSRFRRLMKGADEPAFSLGGCDGFNVACVLKPSEVCDFPFSHQTMDQVEKHLATRKLRLASQPFIAGALPNTPESFFGVVFFPTESAAG